MKNLNSASRKLGNSKTFRGTFFKLYSENAERVEVCIFDPAGNRELLRSPMVRFGNYFCLEIEKDLENHCYGYRVCGPWDPQNGHRFNYHKLLLDPYAKEIRGSLVWDSAIYAHHPDLKNLQCDLEFNDQDSAPFVPKSVVRAELKPLQVNAPKSDSRIPDLIYEMHIKGFSQKFPGIRESLRGTYSALNEPAIYKYLREIGAETLEFLPIHYFIDQPFQLERNLTNYWGYNTLNFFTPHPGYARQNYASEFQLVIANLKTNGFKVISDVVYNHTAEGNQFGPSLCYRGIDNKVYYELEEAQRFYRNDSGCGNILNFRHPIVQQLTRDSLEYWHRVMGIDGFRFDLASVLKKKIGETEQDFFEKIRSEPFFESVILIAEPWDATFEGRKTEQFDGCLEWTDLFRDRVRQFWRGDEGIIKEFAESFSGGISVGYETRKNFREFVNFVTCHDGFTLRDLNSYDKKHNETNLEGNRDGVSENYSYNHGTEGIVTDSEIEKKRIRTAKAMLATVVLSLGTPMILAGDETGNSQGGNNNSYCMDNEIGYILWEEAPEWKLELTDCLKQANEFKKLYEICYPRNVRELRKNRKWYNPNGSEMTNAYWEEHFAKSIALKSFGNNLQKKTTVYFMFNASRESVCFSPPVGFRFEKQLFSIDTQNKSPDQISENQVLELPPCDFRVYELLFDNDF